MPKLSAGILLYRKDNGRLEVFLSRPLLGPFWKNKDIGAWSIPKGEYELGEDPKSAATARIRRGFGHALPAGELVPLSRLTTSGKIVFGAVCSGGFSLAGHPG